MPKLTEKMILDNAKNNLTLYRNNLAILKSNNLPIFCGNCHKSITDFDYLNYAGYCKPCLIDVNLKANQRYHKEMSALNFCGCGCIIGLDEYQCDDCKDALL